MPNIVLLGAPGAGKGTQAENITKKYGIPQISTGDIFRANIKEQTALGTEAKSYMDKGLLVPDELTVRIVTERLTQPDCANGFVLDGFPRTIPQAEAIGKWLAERGQRIDAVVNIHVPDDRIIERMSGRRVCKACGKSYHVLYNPPAVEDVCDKCGGELILRADDEPATVRERLAVYHSQTAPLIDYYKPSGVFLEILGREKVEDTSTEVLYGLEHLLAKRQ